MNDFLLNDKGDLMFTRDNLVSRFRMDFLIGEQDGFCARFDTQGADSQQPESQFRVRFKTSNLPARAGAMVVEKDSALAQAIRIRLKTQRGEILERSRIGSDIYRYKHEPVNNPTLARRIEQTVREAIVDILPEATVQVVREKVPHNIRNSGYVAGIYLHGRRLLKFHI